MIEGRPTEPVRAFVNIVPDDRERGYSSIVKVLSNREYAHQLLETALAGVSGPAEQVCDTGGASGAV